MARKDDYYNRAKQQGYRARSAYKLIQLDETVGVLSTGDVVVDLGAAPGGWLQIAAERVGDAGTVLGVDRQRIEPLEGVETVRGDLTEDATHEAIRSALGAGGDERPVDVVLSDMAPDMSGEYGLDHARSIHLATIAADLGRSLLRGGGTLVVKVFDGPDLGEFRASLESDFERVRAVTPDASRDASSERYVVATGRLTAPVRSGDVLAVDIEDLGEEGDGIARVDGFTLFVPGTAVGDSLTVRVTDVKRRFGFAEPLD